MSNTKAFLKSTLVYGIGTLLPKIISILLIPVYTHYISPSDYGYYDLTLTIITLVTSVIYFDIWISTLRHMNLKGQNKFTIAKSGIFIFLISTLFLLILTLAVSITSPIRFLALILFYGIVLNAVTLIGFISRGNHDSKGFVYTGVINSLLTASSGVIFLSVFNFGIKSLYISSIIGSFTQLAILLARNQLLIRIITAPYSRLITKKLLLYSAPLVINTTGYWLIVSYGRFLAGLNSLSENGLYAIAFRYSTIVALITTIFNFAWQDILFCKKYNDNIERNVFFSKGGNLYIKFLMGFITILMPAIFCFNIFFTHNNFIGSIKYTPLLLLVSAGGAYLAYLGSIFHTLLKSKLLFYSTLAAASVSVCFSPLALQLLGPNGLSIVAVVSILVCATIRENFLRKHVNYKPLSTKSGCSLVIWFTITYLLFCSYSIVINIITCLVNAVIFMIVFKDSLLKKLFRRSVK